MEWRCSDSLSLREFLLLEMQVRVPDHSWLSRTRARLPHEVHTPVFDWVLALIAEAGLADLGRAHPAMPDHGRPTRRCRHPHGSRVTGGCWSAWPQERVSRHPRLRTWRVWTASARAEALEPGLGFQERPEAKIAKMKRRNHAPGLHKPEHAVDLDTGAVVWWRSCTRPTRAIRQRVPKMIWRRPRQTLEAGCGADGRRSDAECRDHKGYHSRLVLRRLDDGPWKSRISGPSRRVLRAGTEMMRLAGRSPTTGPGCYRGWPGKPSSCRR